MATHGALPGLVCCYQLAADADFLRLTGRQLLLGDADGGDRAALCQERLRMADELASCCARVTGWFADGELPAVDRDVLDRAVKDAVERAQLARQFYADLLAWIEQGGGRRAAGPA
jgi:hypothetical protein